MIIFIVVLYRLIYIDADLRKQREENQDYFHKQHEDRDYFRKHSGKEEVRDYSHKRHE